jgi:hypothetical protein
MAQAEAIWSGKHVATRQDEEHEVLLYKIDGFFVEVFYHGAYNAIRKFVPIANKDQLLFYGNQ